MADAFTLGVKVEAIRRLADRRGMKSRVAIGRRLDEIERYIRLKLPLSEIKNLVIDMRVWCWTGPLEEARWFDDRLEHLAEYLSTPEEKLELRELTARLEADILAFHAATS